MKQSLRFINTNQSFNPFLHFQFPAVYKNGMVLVISPLIALMQAQVIALLEARIPACLVGSAQPDLLIMSKIEKGEFNVIYSSPEFLQGHQGKRLLDVLHNRLILIAIDGSYAFYVLFFNNLIFE